MVAGTLPRPRPRFVRNRPIIQSGTLPRPRPRFAEIGDQAQCAVACDYIVLSRVPIVTSKLKGVEAFAHWQVWSHNSQIMITRRLGTGPLSRHTHLSYLAIDSAFDVEKARNASDAFTEAAQTFLGALAQATL